MKVIRTPSLTTLHLPLPSRLQDDVEWYRQGQTPSILSRLSEFHINIALTSSVLALILTQCSKIQRCYIPVYNDWAAPSFLRFTETTQRCIHLEEIQLQLSCALANKPLVEMIESWVNLRPAGSAHLRKVRVFSYGQGAREAYEESFPASVDVAIERSCSWVRDSRDRRREKKRIWDRRYASTGPASWKALESIYHGFESEGD